MEKRRRDDRAGATAGRSASVSASAAEEDTQELVDLEFVSKLHGIVQTAEWHAQTISSQVPGLEQQQESFLIKYHAFVRVESEFTSAQQRTSSSSDVQAQHFLRSLKAKKEQQQQQLTKDAQDLLNKRQALHAHLSKGTGVLEEGSKIFLDKLQDWRTAQRLRTASQTVMTAALNKLQKWADSLVRHLWQLRQSARRLAQLQARLPLNPQAEARFEAIVARTNGILSLLVHRSLIVERQPPQVLKTQTRFQATVRFLVGAALNLHLDAPELRAYVVNERQTRQICEMTMAQEERGGLDTPIPKPVSSGDILNSSKPMTVMPGATSLQATFKTLSLRKIRRSEKSEQIDYTVTEQKFSICFRMRLTLPGGDTTYLVQELSSPVVVVVHGNQVPSAQATVLWDNAFALPNRRGFEVEQAVTWRRLVPHLRRFWTQCDLNPLKSEHLELLAKLLHLKAADDMVPWSRFSKDCLPSRTFSFWEWFYGCSETTRKHLKELWDDDLIHGFIDKEQAFQALAGSPPSTFLVRFSTSIVSSVSVSWIGASAEGMQVYHLQPWMNKDFSIRSLADRISDLDQLQLLYPDRPKNAAFARHYSSQAEQQDSKMLSKGYIPADLRAFIDPSDVGNDPTYQPRSDMDYSAQPTTTTPSVSTPSGTSYHGAQSSDPSTSSGPSFGTDTTSREPPADMDTPLSSMDLSWLTSVTSTSVPITATAATSTLSATLPFRMPTCSPETSTSVSLSDLSNMYVGSSVFPFDNPSFALMHLDPPPSVPSLPQQHHQPQQQPSQQHQPQQHQQQPQASQQPPQHPFQQHHHHQQKQQPQQQESQDYFQQPRQAQQLHFQQQQQQQQQHPSSRSQQGRPSGSHFSTI